MSIKCDTNSCNLCETCTLVCPTGACELGADGIEFDNSLCCGCNECVDACPNDALTDANNQAES